MTVAEMKAEEAFGQRLEEFAGEWVAVRQHDVLAHAPTLEELLGELEEKEVTAEAVFQVLEDADCACFF